MMVFMFSPVSVNAASNKITLKNVNSPTTVNIGNGYSIKGKVKGNLSGYLYKTTKRSPMILPVIIEV